MMFSDNSICWRGWSEEQLAAYQSDQGPTNHCAKHAAASVLNMLFGLVLSADDLIHWVGSRPFKGTGRYTILGNHNGSLVYQTANLVRELGRQVGLPITVKSRNLRKSALLEILQSQDKLALVTLTYLKGKEPLIARGTNTSSSLAPVSWAGGHILIPAAYDPGHIDQKGLRTPWGFLSSWGAKDQIYWMTEDDFLRCWGKLSIYNTVLITRTGR